VQPANLADLARTARLSYPQRDFVVFEDERVTFDAWFRATAAFGRFLVEQGIQKGDRIAIAMRNLPEWPVAFFASTSVGAIVVPLNAWWTGPELAYGLQQSASKLVICDPERWDRIAPHMSELPKLRGVIVTRAFAPLCTPAIGLETIIGKTSDYAALPDNDLPDVEIAPDDDATIFYTSGTTGKPKGAVGSHRNALTCITNIAYAFERDRLRQGREPAPSERHSWLIVIPMFHVTASISWQLPAIAFGNTLVFMHKWDTVRAFELIESERIVSTGGVPSIAWQILEHPERHKYDLSSLQRLSYGGAPSAPELVRRIDSELRMIPSSGWGMTETTSTVTQHGARDYLNRPESCGPPMPVADLKIMSRDGTHELPTGEVGELWVKGPQVVRGYWESPEETATTFIDGWVRTGDLAKLDAEGFCYIVDRAKDIVIRGGENIYSSEVENRLYEHPAVVDAALIGLPHKTLGEEPAAVVHLSPGETVTEDELRAWVAECLAAFKVPVRIAFWETTLPRNANGKIEKKKLRQVFN
jgi:acyl-CoA synthetase (AMP-forming)/AMP-acid ligase II